MLVAIDDAGKPISIENVGGPDWVCKSVTAQDVVALRNEAVAAAMKTTFSPAEKDGKPVKSTLWLNYNFPSAPKFEAKSKKEPVYVASTVGEGSTFEGKPVGQTPDIAKTDPNDSKPDRYTISPGPIVGADAVGIISGGVLNGTAMKLPKPPYPPAARAVRASGAVTILVLIDTNGNVYSAEPTGGHPLLRAASRQAACGAQFLPTMLSGRPVKVRGIITYNFVP